MKKYVKIALLVIVALIFIGTFVFLYQKSQPKASVYTILNAEITDLKKTTVATGKIEPRDEILIKPQISGIIDEVYKEAGQKIKKGEVIAKVKVIPRTGTTKLGRKPCKTGRNQCQTRRNGLCPYEKTVRKQTYQQ